MVAVETFKITYALETQFFFMLTDIRNLCNIRVE